MKNLCLVFLAVVPLTVLGQVRDERGVTVGADVLVRVEPVAENIIRVRAVPTGQFENKAPSLMVVQQTQPAPRFSVSEEDGKVMLATAALKACVDKRTGRVEFRDAAGELLLGESASGKKFRRNADGYTWQLQFESPEDEAFYGLGQHQAGELDMKGKNEELFQYNTKISVPFVVSSRGYGLLWDSNSLCRWGNPEEYAQLGDVLTLYDKEGRRGALTGTYKDAGGRTLTRREETLYFEHSRVIGNLPREIALDGASVVYEGDVEAPADATYHFMLYYAGYTRVTMDGQEVVAERWRTAWNPNSWKFALPMKAGEKRHLRIEWKPDGAVSYCGLRVAKPRSEAEQAKLTLWSELTPDMDYYFIYGGTEGGGVAAAGGSDVAQGMASSPLDKVIAGYRQLTGRAQVMPRWAMGFWQSRERYQTQDEIVGTLAEFRRRHIPVDNIVQDWNYWKEDEWGSHEFESSRYPDPQQMLDSVHAMHGRFMISVWPKFYCSTDNYKELDANGWMYRQAVRDSIRDWVGPGYIGSFYDAYSPGARRMFWRQLNEKMFSRWKFGIDAWWMDASEPNVRDCTPIDYRKALCGPTALGSSTEYFNAYSLVNADAIYNGQRATNPMQRVFLLTRSGFAGLQRYSTASWSGDIGTRWEDMRAQMTAGMNYSLSGIPFWGMDIGGFCVEKRYVEAQKLFDETGVENEDLREWRELQARWTQFGCFVPLYRAHGQWPLREVWNIAPEGHAAYESIVYYHRLRYRLMPYLYSIAAWANTDHYTLMRALVMDFGHDKNVRDIKDQWMFGPSFMACPVGEYGARSREVYLPEGCGWYDLYSGKRYRGGQRVTVNAPYGRIPVFVPEGGIVPIGADMEWSGEKKGEEITLYVYGGRDGHFRIYEDDGLTYAYEKGERATIDVTYDDATQSVTIGECKGAYAGMPRERTFRVVFVNAKRGVGIDRAKGTRTVKYVGEKVVVRK